VKKVIALIFALGLWHINCRAQGFIVKWSGGYAWSGNPKSENISCLNTDFKNPGADAFVNMANSSDADGSYKAIHTSYGQGFNFNFRLGYMINPYIGIDLGVSYLKSASISCSQVHYLYIDSSGVSIPTGGYMNCAISSTAQNISLSPAIVAAFAKPKMKFYPYLRAGLVLPVWTQIQQTIGIDLLGVTALPALSQAPYFLGQRTDATIQTQGKFALGFCASIGAIYRPLPYFGIFIEVNGEYLNLKASSSTITQWTADGYDLLSTRGPYRTQFNYVGSLSSSSNNAQKNSNYNPNNPKEDISPQFPFSNVGFNIGLQLLLNKELFNDGKPVKKKAKSKKA
jgi:hypothetical protein